LAQIVRGLHVNLVDFVDTRRTGKPVQTFASIKQLQTYTLQTGKVFPKRRAKEGGLVRHLLRPIWMDKAGQGRLVS
jgi:hypothetical protein